MFIILWWFSIAYVLIIWCVGLVELETRRNRFYLLLTGFARCIYVFGVRDVLFLFRFRWFGL